MLIGLVAAVSGPAVAAVREDTSLLVGGPPGGRADRWADAVIAPLRKAMQPAGTLGRTNVGGADGVTAANQFEALTIPDGTTALLVPGQAALAWMAGESRVQFDAARWIPVWGGTCGAVLASRVRLTPGRPVRLAAPNLVGPELAALLTLELMGIEAVPVAVPAAAALERPDVDAVFLAGSALRSEGPALSAAGLAPALCFGTLDAAGQPMRDPAFPDLPSAAEATRGEGSPGLQAALRAVAAAAQLDIVLVLPQACPAAAVAQWRRGGAALTQAPSVQAEAARTGTRPLGAQAASVSAGAIAAELPTLLELRRWLAARYGWQPA